MDNCGSDIAFKSIHLRERSNSCLKHAEREYQDNNLE